ncbi:MAG: 16S ribosomal RNA methyltransferase A [Methanobrevibacter sp.]|jgi:16S rRNA (adenine1518-N6/adenine1519-N6)-dimethyltransferase|nr:16S ribosomal RNA methyltransferase A [Methanobrevibacter sp.]
MADDLSLFQETKQVLNDNGISLKRSLGQNYLIDDFKRKKIIDFANLNKEDVVLEIGPGIGTLSLKIAEKVKKLVVVEQDKKIFDILSKRIKAADLDNVELLNGDAVKIDFPNFNKVVSNLPYQISSPITFKLLDYDFDYGILTYQKEFASRMVGKVNTKEYSRLSAMLYFKGDIDFLEKLSPSAFFPKPKVDSSVIKLTPKKDKEFIEYEKEYSTISKAIFQHKNKKIRNALIDSRHILGYSDKNDIKGIFEELSNNDLFNKYLNSRTINTPPEDILRLSKLFKPYLNLIQ